MKKEKYSGGKDEFWRHDKDFFCQKCGDVLDSSDDLPGVKQDTNTAPRPGDVCICCYCGSINIWNEDMTVRLATPAELEELKKETPPDIWKVLTDTQLLFMQMAAENKQKKSYN